MPHAECSNCSCRFEFDPSTAVGTCTCPKCGAALSLEGTEWASPAPSADPAPPPLPPSSAPIGAPQQGSGTGPKRERSDWGTLAAILAWFCLAAGGMAVIGHMQRPRPSVRDWGYEQRFQTDNAIGATANAAEAIKRSVRELAEPKSSGAAPWIICGFLAWLIASVEGLRKDLRAAGGLTKAGPGKPAD